MRTTVAFTLFVFSLINLLPNLASAATSFDFLNSVYENASMPALSKFEGAYSGRCFDSMDPDGPTPAILMSYTLKGEFKVDMRRGGHKQPDYYDSFTPQELEKFKEELIGWTYGVQPIFSQTDHWEIPVFHGHLVAREAGGALIVQVFGGETQFSACFFNQRLPMDSVVR